MRPSGGGDGDASYDGGAGRRVKRTGEGGGGLGGRGGGGDSVSCRPSAQAPVGYRLLGARNTSPMPQQPRWFTSEALLSAGSDVLPWQVKKQLEFVVSG